MRQFVVSVAFLALFFARIYLDSGFRRSLRREAPQAYQRLAGPKARRSLLSRAPIEYARMMLLRTYRKELADYPASRAWASWISFVDWALVAFVAAFGIAAIRNAA
ncbi:MAG TPA: hypothetical protein VLY46_16955 [Usitatibacter sp.]|nr:hypothetical protein [Usitatibacter sp.]